MIQRWLPSLSGIRSVRIRPPYWNNIDRVMCCEVGEEYNICQQQKEFCVET